MPIEPLPGWLARRRRDRSGRRRRCWPEIPSGRGHREAGILAGLSAVGMSAESTRPPRVHQVLATLGYGDAIGHEVLGIQRVLRARRLRVRDLRRDRRSAARGPDGRLPRHGRRDRPRRRADPPLLDRIARLAHRLRAARPHGARLPQHHAAGVLHRRPQGAGEAVLPRPPRADRLHRRAASWRSATPNTTGRSSRRSASAPPASCPSSRISRTSIGAPDSHAGRGLRRRLDQRACSSAA